MGCKRADSGSRRWLPLVKGYNPSRLVALVFFMALVADTEANSAVAPIPKRAYACEGMKIKLNCETEGEVIRIEEANYGRLDVRVCNDWGITAATKDWNLQCTTPKAKEIMSEKCHGHRSCEVHVNSKVFSEPCPGTYKYADVKYTCVPAESKTEQACEGTSMRLTCEAGEVIRILRANYGRFSMWICNERGETEGWNLQCHTPKAKDIVSERCDGRRSCQVNVNSNVFREPCLGTFKYAEVKYKCEKEIPDPPPAVVATTAKPLWNPDHGRPRPPAITSVTALSATAAEVVWTQDDSAEPTVAGLYIAKTDQTRKENINSYFVTWPVKSKIIENLSPGTRYELFVKAFHKHAQMMTSPSVVFTTPAQETTTLRPDLDMPNSHTSDSTVKLYPKTTTSTAQPRPVLTEQPPKPDIHPESEYTIRPPGETVRPTNEWFPSREYIPTPDQGNGVVDRFCEVKIHEGVTWPRTRFGKTEENICPFPLIGKSTWRCLGYGWEKAGPDMSQCISSWLEELANADSPSDEAVVALSSMMRDRNMTCGDLNRTAMKLLPKLVHGIPRMLDNKSDEEKKRKMKKFKKDFMASSSSLLNRRNSKSWRALSKQDRKRSATSLIIAVEDAGFQSASFIDPGKKEVDIDTNLVMQVNVVDHQKVHNDIRFPLREDLSKSNWERNSDSITITNKSLKGIGMQAKGPINIVFTLYMNLEELIQPQSNTISTIPMLKNDGNYNAGTISDSNAPENDAVLEINSKIISASIGSTKLRRRLLEPVRFTLEHLTATDKAVPVCSFWEIDSSYLSGQWSQEGCNLLDTNSTHSTCECDHLTNFAILMDVTGTKLSEKHELALRAITFVGCVISIVCLMLSWTTFMVFKNLQCDRNTIHKNLVLCLLLAEILFLGGIAQTEPKILCSIIAGALHYLFLGAFAWMCLEGVQLYVMLVEVFEQERSRVKWYYLFGYGVPAVVVATSAGVYYQGYGTARHCWLTTERAFIWSFVGPALAVMLINIVMLGIAIYTMCRHSNMSATMKERSKTTKFSAWVKGAVVLVVLLGLTWILGVFYLNEESVVIAYFFTALNSFQGMFIFVFHCIKNEKVQKEYRKVARRTSWLPNCIRVNYGGYTGVASSSPIASSGSGHYLSKLFGQRRRSAASTNSSAKPFLSKDQHQRSDNENSSSRDSSMVPSSLNGYIYTPGQPNGKDQLGYKPSHKNGNGIILLNGPNQLTPCYETDGVAGDLSEYIDCSVVDSEFVSEYCRHNMQVSMDEKRYSTGSEDSKVLSASNNLRLAENDNLSTLSLASSSRKPASLLSSLETVNNPVNDTSEYKLAGQIQKEGSDPRLNLHQYIIPTSRKIVNNNHLNVANVHENDTKKWGVGELKSSSMNKLTKPAHSLSSIPETETSPQHSSTPNIQYKLGFGYTDSHSDSAPSTAASSPNSVCSHRNIPIGIYEDLTPSSTMGSPSSIKSSLPNLEVLSIECDSPDMGCPKRRHSSETDIQFSPFRFTSTEC